MQTENCYNCSHCSHCIQPTIQQ